MGTLPLIGWAVGGTQVDRIEWRTSLRRKGLRAMFNCVIIYAADIEATASFYETHFQFTVRRLEGDRIVELTPNSGGGSILLHPAAKGQRRGQSIVKLVFDVQDVSAFCGECVAKGLTFGPVHVADGYEFANAKDPCGNSISVSSRAYRSPLPDASSSLIRKGLKAER
jgi:predicted enzyme related to lactoylglutathione lyase